MVQGNCAKTRKKVYKYFVYDLRDSDVGFFFVNFAKNLRTPFLIEHLWCLLLKRLDKKSLDIHNQVD